MTKIIGIDLGTTNSVACILEGTTPTIIPNNEGQLITPSIVAYTNNKELLIGSSAKRQSIINPLNTFYSVKRFIGKKYSEIQEIINSINYNIIEENKQNNNVVIYCPILEKKFYPEEISALLLKKLSNDASKFVKEPINKAVITVPAYFNDSQRLATKKAGMIAGLNVLRILNEPTAAALAYGLNNKKNEIILVFDLGGGTLDISLLEMGENIYEVLATSGDTYLGGDDFDFAITQYILEEFFKQENINLNFDKQAMQRILEASERAKIELSYLDSTVIHLSSICVDPQSKIAKNITMVLSRKKFEKICDPLFQRCKKPLFNVLEDGNIDKKNINDIILVGGSTKLAGIQSLLKRVFNKELNDRINGNFAAGVGAAIQGGILAGQIKNLVLLDVTPLSLGVETAKNIMTTIIPRNTPIPVKKSEVFSTNNELQTSVEIHILQGEHVCIKKNKSLGTFFLTNLPKKIKDSLQIMVTFKLDEDGLLTVTAQEDLTRKKQSIKIDETSVLSQSDKNLIEKLP